MRSGLRWVRPYRRVPHGRLIHLAAGELEITLCSRVRAGEDARPGDGEPCPRCVFRAVDDPVVRQMITLGSGSGNPK